MNVESQIGQYKIVRTLGAGGMGTVYLGEHILLGRRAAIKTLLPSLSSHREIVDRFFNEARAISAISDPGVVQIFDFGYHVDGTAYIVMEFLEGEALSTRLERLGKLPLIDALRITRQIAVSLGAAHARGIIHRDLKPGNVFVIRDGEAQGGERTKILDFGIAKLVSTPADAVATQTGTMLGTPVYMSPEQCRGAGQVDHRSDIYSVGCALFHMLTGVPPFDCDAVGDFIAAHLKEEPPAPSELAAELPPAVDALVLRCLAKRPEDRFQTMGELEAECESVLAHLSDPGATARPGPMSSTPLGEGFKSEYDVNRGNRLRTAGATPARSRASHDWFVDSMSQVSVSSVGEESHDWAPERGMSALQKLALVLALIGGLVGGIALTVYLLGQDEETAVAASPLLPPSAETKPSPATTNETAPAEPVAGSGHLIAPELDAEATDVDVETKAEPAAAAVEAPAPATPAPVVTEKQKPARPHPARTPVRPRPRNPSPQPAPEQPPQDDLYDTR